MICNPYFIYLQKYIIKKGKIYISTILKKKKKKKKTIKKKKLNKNKK